MKLTILTGLLFCVVTAPGQNTAHALAPQAAATPETAPSTTSGQVPAAQGATGLPATAQSSAASSPAEADAKNNYIIGPSDSLEINVWKEPTLSGTLPVRPDGMISLALVGDLQASGLTPMQLSAAIATRLKRYITDPLVNVTVLGVNSRKVYLLGEVGKAGEVPLTAGMTPLQAIAAAGGLGPYADAKHIYILRSVNGKPEKIAFDYKKAIKTGNLQGVTLVTGDTIVVP